MSAFPTFAPGLARPPTIIGPGRVDLQEIWSSRGSLGAVLTSK
jgi:hypothetical protein